MKVVITGTSQGIGLATAILFLNNNHKVVGLDNQESHISHPNYTHCVCDVSDKLSMPVIYDADILINNAGVQHEGLNLAVNLIGTVNATEMYGLQPNIKAILNVASVSAHNGAEFPLYTASKGAVLAYTKWLAQEVAKYGATANSLSPGGVVTPMTTDIWNDPAKRAAVLDETLLGRWASAQEIAEWIYFICVVNKSMTAQDIIIDNGETAKYNFIQ